MTDKVLQLIGLCFKSRHLVCGTDTVISSLQKQKLHLVMISSDASSSLIDKIEKKAFFYKVPVIIKYDSDTYLKTIGKKTMIIGIDDEGFTKAIMKELES